MASKREKLEPNRGDQRYTRRNKQRQFTQQDDISRAARQDPRRPSQSEAPRGQGNRGDRADTE
jgi:hypothetical protein